MNMIDSFEFAASTESLRRNMAEKSVPEHLLAPLQSLLKAILAADDGKSLSVYLHSDDQAREVRSYFAHTLAKVLVEHVPTAVVVDCDFLNPGMSGVVPQKNALGFLDFLLYGSSLGVVSQDSAAGARIIGAGSFPLTKKMPVSQDAFEDAARRLGAQSRLAIFCGPSEDDEGNIHPVASMVDLPVYLSYASNFPAGRMSPFEERLSAELNTRVVSVRVTGLEPAPAAATPSPPPETDKTGNQPAKQPPKDGPEPVPAGAEAEGGHQQAGNIPGSAMADSEPDQFDLDNVEYRGLPFEERKSSSRLPKIITFGVAGFVVLFVGWWLITSLGSDQPSPPPDQTAGGSVQPADQMADAGGRVDDPAAFTEEPAEDGSAAGAPAGNDAGPAGDRPADQESESGSPAEAGQTGQQPETADPGQAAAGGRPAETGIRATDGSEVCMVDDFTSFGGKYLVHISSFRTVERAVEDVAYLNERNFEACVVPVDLGSKGQWYRVYVGPLDTREDARELKIMLDELPRVTFTRITRAPGGPR